MSLNQRGSILMDTVLFMALLSVFFMALIGQLTFMSKVSAQEDARVQGLMAARIQMENMRSEWDFETGDWKPFDPVRFDESSDGEPHDIHRLDFGEYRVTQLQTDLYRVEIRITDNAGRVAFQTQSQVWVK